MEVIRSEIMGFCAGVRRAVNAAQKALDQREQGEITGKVYTFGPLIHNPIALAELAKRSLGILGADDIDSLKAGDAVLIRAHGVPPETEAALKDTGASVINATCPLVTASQKRAADFAKKGYAVILAGDKNHGETTGIAGYAEKSILENKTGSFYLVENRSDATALFEKKAAPEKAVLLSQTTFSVKEFDAISQILKSKIPEIEIISTICPATHERQDALVELCSKVDGVLVIGGKNSANTGRLLITAEKLSSHAALIEKADEIPHEFFSLNRVGITAGASTPDSVISAVEAALKAGKSQ